MVRLESQWSFTHVTGSPSLEKRNRKSHITEKDERERKAGKIRKGGGSHKPPSIVTKGKERKEGVDGNGKRGVEKPGQENDIT